VTQTDTTVRKRGKRVKRLAFAAGVPILALSLLGSALPASAITPTPRAQIGSDNDAGGFASTYVGDDGALADCIQPGSPSPFSAGQFRENVRNVTIPGNQWGGPVTLNDQQSAAINMLTTTHNVGLSDQSAEAKARRGAVAIVVKNVVSQQWEYNVLRDAGYTGAVGDIGAQTYWSIYPAGADTANRARDLANQYWAEAQRVTVGSSGQDGKPGTITGSFNVDPNDNYKGSVTLNTSGDTDGTWTLTLHNGKFTSNGATSGEFKANGSRTLTQQIEGVPPTPGADYKIKADYSYSVPGKPGSDGWKPTLNVTGTSDGTQWVASGTGMETSIGSPGTVSGSVSDPMNRASQFSPKAVTTSDSRYYVSGDTATDNIRVLLGKNADGTTNRWPRSSKGDYAPINVTGTLYGPFKTKPEQGSKVPDGAPVAGTGKVTVGGNATDPTTVTYKITSNGKLDEDQAKASGWYTWVTQIAGKDQAASVAPWLDGGARYTFVSDFGIDDESFVSPPKVTTKARTTTGITTNFDGVDVPTTGLGLKVEDDIKVEGNVSKSDGFYLVNRYYTFPNTIGENGDLVAPANAVCTADTLTYTSDKVEVTGPKTYKVSHRSKENGVGTWVATLYSPDGKPLIAGDCADTDEWAAVKQLLVTTSASTPGDGQATDAAQLWGTVPEGSQITSNLYEQLTDEVSDADKHLATAGPMGLNEGLVNGVIVTLPTVAYKASEDAKAVYFVEAVYDLDGKVIAMGKRGIPSETIPLTPPPTPEVPEKPNSPTGKGEKAAAVGGGGAAATLPIVSG